MSDAERDSLAEARHWLAAGEAARAELIYHRVLAANPRQVDALCALGGIAHGRRRYADAVRFLTAAAKLDRRNVELLLALGDAQGAQGELAQAVASYRKVLSLKPDLPVAHHRAGIALWRLRRMDEALRALGRAAALAPGNADVHSDTGVVLRGERRFDEAIASFRRALDADPDHVYARYNLGNALQAVGRLDEARACFRRAIELTPGFADPHTDLGWNLLLRGEFDPAWREYEWRVQAATGEDYARDPRDRSRCLPRPSSLLPLELRGRRVLLLGEQGLGDELFFLRFAPAIKAGGAWLGYLGSQAIASILRRTPFFDDVRASGDEPVAAGITFLVGDLPLVLGSDLPAPLPLAAAPGRLEAMREKMAATGPGPYLGVTWRAGKPRQAGPAPTLFKHIPPAELARSIRHWPGSVLVLQRNPAPGELGEFARGLGRAAHDFSACNDDLEDMLALLALVDDYVGVSNTNMHLRASLGRPARVLVADPPEFRWMAEGAVSPWFPGFRLYRQAGQGGWQDALSSLAAELPH